MRIPTDVCVDTGVICKLVGEFLICPDLSATNLSRGKFVLKSKKKDTFSRNLDKFVLRRSGQIRNSLFVDLIDY